MCATLHSLGFVSTHGQSPDNVLAVKQASNTYGSYVRH